MIVEFGAFALALALALSVLQTVLSAAGRARRSPVLAGAAEGAAIGAAAATALAFAALIYAFVISDFSVSNVAANSHTDKPMLYKVAGAWGSHEGSLLLWCLVLTVFGAVLARARGLPFGLKASAVATQGALGSLFLAFAVFTSSPFTRLDPAPFQGASLNPLLQDPALAAHPPLLYAGYVGFSVCFSLAVAALIEGRAQTAFWPAWGRWVRPWALASWAFLTVGITLGSFWAYYELGWGGWWFWDPVENASLMPWLAATALLHSVTVLATRDGLRAWTIMLAVVAFSMSMVGTFLVRSGILTSVHAFAVDPERGSFILVLLAIYIGGALALFGWRIGSVREGAPFELVSRETLLVVNNLLLSVILGIVLIGTLYPLMTEAFDHKVSVGAPYFDRIAGPIALTLMIAMAVGPLTRWRRDRLPAVGRRLVIPATGGAIAAAIIAAVAWGRIGTLPFFGLTVAIGVGIASLAPLWKRKLLRTPLFTWGMVIAHLGCAVSLAGMACDSAFTVEKLVAARPGEAIRTAGWTLRFVKIMPLAGDNWTALQADMAVDRGGRAVMMRPQSRFFTSPPTTTSEAALLTRWDGQLYVVLGEEVEGGRWQLRIWWKPFVTLIWFGGVLIALGGALALVGHERRGWLVKWRGRRAVA
ncbi:MAG TPA: heme lyase NrfEFG subunit NrfE [Brevundimonas sp.]|nr:heme lyase NrfEFG subunit NrfE [Brevundimonas sp.]